MVNSLKSSCELIDFCCYQPFIVASFKLLLAYWCGSRSPNHGSRWWQYCGHAWGSSSELCCTYSCAFPFILAAIHFGRKFDFHCVHNGSKVFAPVIVFWIFIPLFHFHSWNYAIFGRGSFTFQGATLAEKLASYLFVISVSWQPKVSTNKIGEEEWKSALESFIGCLSSKDML